MSEELSAAETEATRDCPCPRCSVGPHHERHLCVHHDTEIPPCSCHLKHGKHLCLVHQDLRVKVRRLEKVAAELNGKLKNLKNSRSTAQADNKCLIQQSNQLVEEIRHKTAFTENSIRREEEIAVEAEKWSQIWRSENGKKILADKRLLENAQQVKAIEEQIEYTHRLIEHKRKMISKWQKTSVQKIHRDDLLLLEHENMDTEKKMAEWFKENRRLLMIFEAMKDREIQMIFAAERCLQRNRQAREECSEMQSRILAISKALDEQGIRTPNSSTSSTITLHSQLSAPSIIQRQPAGGGFRSESNVNFSDQGNKQQQRISNDGVEAESVDDDEEKRHFLELMMRRCNFGLLDYSNIVASSSSS